MIDLNVNDILESKNHHIFIVDEVRLNGDVIAHDNQSRTYLLDRLELKEMSKISR